MAAIYFELIVFNINIDSIYRMWSFPLICPTYLNIRRWQGPVSIWRRPFEVWYFNFKNKAVVKAPCPMTYAHTFVVFA